MLRIHVNERHSTCSLGVYILAGGDRQSTSKYTRRSFQTMLCAMKKMKQGAGCRVICGIGVPLGKGTGLGRSLQAVMLMLRPAL